MAKNSAKISPLPLPFTLHLKTRHRCISLDGGLRGTAHPPRRAEVLLGGEHLLHLRAGPCLWPVRPPGQQQGPTGTYFTIHSTYPKIVLKNCFKEAFESLQGKCEL